jgi:Ca-activated chloride channel homolog
MLLMVLILVRPAVARSLSMHLSQVDKSDFPIVRIYLYVEDMRGDPLTHLRAGQFRVYEGGAPVTISGFVGPNQLAPLASVLVLDCSGSMIVAGKIQALKDAAYAYVLLLKPGDEVGIVPFSSRVGTIVPLTGDKMALSGGLQGLQADGRTAFFDALDQALELLSGIRGRRAVLAITDGMDNASWKSETDVTDYARRLGIPIYVIGLGNPNPFVVTEGIDERTLQRIAGNSGGLYFRAPSAAQLRAIYESLARRFQSSYEIAYESPTPLADGTTRQVMAALTVRGTAASAPGYYYLPGVVVAASDWRVFIALAIPLLFLLFLPALAGYLRGMIGAARRA